MDRGSPGRECISPKLLKTGGACSCGLMRQVRTKHMQSCSGCAGREKKDGFDL